MDADLYLLPLYRTRHTRMSWLAVNRRRRRRRRRLYSHPRTVGYTGPPQYSRVPGDTHAHIESSDAGREGAAKSCLLHMRIPESLYDRRPARMLAGSTARAPPPARLSRAD